MRTIGDLAAFVTSKNAAPFLLTLDIVFPDAGTYECFKARRPPSPAVVAGLYGIDEGAVQRIIDLGVAVEDPFDLFPIHMLET